MQKIYTEWQVLLFLVTSEILTAVLIKIQVILDVTPCILVNEWIPYHPSSRSISTYLLNPTSLRIVFVPHTLPLVDVA
jgi:hypothetical protein